MSPQKPDSSLPASVGLRGDRSRDGRPSVLRTARDLEVTRQPGAGRLPFEEISQERGQEWWDSPDVSPQG